MRLFHIVQRPAWTAALAAGTYRPPSLEAEGFVHFSFADQVAGTANARFRGAPGLVVVEFDSARIGADVVVEDSYGSGTAFPHVYAPIPVAAAVAVHELRRDAGGDYGFSPDRAADAASPDR